MQGLVPDTVLIIVEQPIRHDGGLFERITTSGIDPKPSIKKRREVDVIVSVQIAGGSGIHVSGLLDDLAVMFRIGDIADDGVFRRGLTQRYAKSRILRWM